MTRRKAHQKQAGFTLVEAMIAMTAGLVTVLATYQLGSMSSRTFNEQMRITETQGSLRSAMDQLQRDIPRAGFLSAPDSLTLPVCAGIAGSTVPASDVVNGRLFGAHVFARGSHADSFVSSVLQPSGTGVPSQLTRADRLELFGNFHTGDVFKISSEGSSTRLVFEPTRESFRRNFVTRDGSGVEVASEAAFRDTFAVGRIVRIESDRHFFFRRIASVEASDMTMPSITLASPVPEACFKRSTALVTPLTWIRYQVEPVTGEAFRRLPAPRFRGAARRVALVRSELNPEDGSVRAGSQRLVLDYAVEFRVDGVVPGATPNTWRTLTDQASGGDQVDSPNLQGQLRTLRVVLAARAQDVESAPQGSAFRAGTDPLSPLLAFPVDVGEPTLRRARVRSLRQEFFLPNMGL